MRWLPVGRNLGLACLSLTCDGNRSERPRCERDTLSPYLFSLVPDRLGANVTIGAGKTYCSHTLTAKPAADS